MATLWGLGIRLWRKKSRVGLGWGAVLWVGVTACAHKPTVSPEIAAARAELSRLESNIANRKSQLPRVAAAPMAVDSVPALSPSAAQNAPAPRCDGICLTAQAICGYERRACALSQDIADEPSQRVCKNAERDCKDASDQCAGCR